MGEGVRLCRALQVMRRILKFMMELKCTGDLSDSHSGFPVRRKEDGFFI